MILTIEALKAAGGFVAAPIKQDVTWHGTDGKPVTATFYVRPDSFHTITSKWKNEAEGADAIASRIVSCIVTEDDKPLFTLADVLGDPATGHGPLSAEITVGLLQAIHKANGLAGGEGDAPKKSRPKKSSGTT